MAKPKNVEAQLGAALIAAIGAKSAPAPAAKPRGKKGSRAKPVVAKPAPKGRAAKPVKPISSTLVNLFAGKNAKDVKVPKPTIDAVKAELGCKPNETLSIVRNENSPKNKKNGYSNGMAVCRRKPNAIVPRKRCPANLKKMASAQGQTCRTKVFAAPKLTEKFTKKYGKALSDEIQTIYGTKMRVKKDGTQTLRMLPRPKNDPVKLQKAALIMAEKAGYAPLKFEKRGKTFMSLKDPSKGTLYGFIFKPKSNKLDKNGQTAAERVKGSKVFAYVQMHRGDWTNEINAAIEADPTANPRRVRGDIIKAKAAEFKAKMQAANKSLRFTDAEVVEFEKQRALKAQIRESIEAAKAEAAANVNVSAIQKQLSAGLKRLGI